MLDEKLKSYNICENCCKNEDCTHYKETCEVMEYFKDTPLNIHFPMCSEYQSRLIKMIKDIELEIPIAEYECTNTEYDRGEEMTKAFCNFNEMRLTRMLGYGWERINE